MSSYADLGVTHDSYAAREMRNRHPKNGWCLRCGTPWAAGLDIHYVVNYNPTSGLFALCDLCWNASTPAEREDYYVRLAAHSDYSDYDINLIKIAIRKIAQAERGPWYEAAAYIETLYEDLSTDDQQLVKDLADELRRNGQRKAGEVR